jgi:hypothetical protein
VNPRVRTGLFALGISLSLVGAVITAQDVPADQSQAAAGTVGDQTTDGVDVEAATSDPPGGLTASGEATTAGPNDPGPNRLPVRSTDPASGTADRADTTLPVTVRIGQIGLEASVIPVGVDDEQQFAVPAAETVGWYKFGAAPGEDGSTVLAAHVDYGGQPGAFFNLGLVEIGEILEVELGDGNVLRYRVIDNVLYDKTALPADDLFRKDGDGVLQLITCGGSFDQQQRSYSGNVVVTAVPERA